jgi:hypothetical protein
MQFKTETATAFFKKNAGNPSADKIAAAIDRGALKLNAARAIAAFSVEFASNPNIGALVENTLFGRMTLEDARFAARLSSDWTRATVADLAGPNGGRVVAAGAANDDVVLRRMKARVAEQEARNDATKAALSAAPSTASNPVLASMARRVASEAARREAQRRAT